MYIIHTTYLCILNFINNEDEQNELLEMCNDACLHFRNGKCNHITVYQKTIMIERLWEYPQPFFSN